MVEFEFEGTIYVLNNRGEWMRNNEVVYQGLQRRIRRAFDEAHPLSDDYVEGMMQRADELINAGDYSDARTMYEHILTNQNTTIRYINYILPRLSSCYRNLNMPNESIALYERYRSDNRYLSSPFLTSVGAAYMDLGKTDEARRAADHAYALNHGQASRELRSLYGRINAAEF